MDGYISGITKTFKSGYYINNAMEYTHAVLGQAFNRWMDMQARLMPENLQHVYEWPRNYHDYAETVGNPLARLWQNTLTGHGSNKTASFRFMASKRASPVNPVLINEDEPEKSVKRGVHIFVWKATAMEYNLPITVSPQLGEWLAFEYDGKPFFTQKSVSFKAGGQKTAMQFTNHFLFWWSTMASSEFDRNVKPKLEKDLLNQRHMNGDLRRGQAKNKTVNVTAQAAQYSRSKAVAAATSEMNMRQNSRDYIEGARARRALIYGD